MPCAHGIVIYTQNVPETPKTGMTGRLFSLTMFRIEPAARFLDAVSGTEGSGRSKKSRLGRVSAGFPNVRRHALGKPRMGPEVIGSAPSPFTNSSRKSTIGPGAKNLSVILLISAWRSPSYVKRGQSMRHLNAQPDANKE